MTAVQFDSEKARREKTYEEFLYDLVRENPEMTLIVIADSKSMKPSLRKRLENWLLLPKTERLMANLLRAYLGSVAGIAMGFALGTLHDRGLIPDPGPYLVGVLVLLLTRTLAKRRGWI